MDRNTDLIGSIDPVHDVFKESGFLPDVHRPLTYIFSSCELLLARDSHSLPFLARVGATASDFPAFRHHQSLNAAL